MSENLIIVHIAEMLAQSKQQGIIWVSCAGSFDDRAKKITSGAFVRILNRCKCFFCGSWY
jgi:hypothetical protein